MIINNQKQAVNLRIKNTLVLLIFVIAIGLIYFTNILPHGTSTYSKNQVAFFTLLLFIIYFLVIILRNHNYIYYSDTGSKFIFRYFSLRPLANKKNAIEFNKNEFHSYQLKQSLFGFNLTLAIYRKTPNGIAKYPPVSITTVNKSDLQKLIGCFERLIRANQIIK